MLTCDFPKVTQIAEGMDFELKHFGSRDCIPNRILHSYLKSLKAHKIDYMIWK